MKMHRLPETDLARIGPLPRDKKRLMLRRHKQAAAPHSYLPVRLTLPDIWNTQYGLLGITERASWEKIEKRIWERSKSAEEFDANIRVAKKLYRHADADNIVSHAEDFLPLQIGIGVSVCYWSKLSYVRDGKAVIPFLDPRRNNSLGRLGRRFAFSMMHQGIRVADPDFENAALEIIHAGSSLNGARTLNFHSDDGVELYSFEELDQMVRETYEIWREVLAEREEEERKKAYSRKGQLL